MNKGLFEEVRRKVIQKKIPLVSHLDLTYQCNLRCVHCYVTKQNRPELSFLEIKSILKQLARAGTLYLTLSGGEILKKRKFFKIASYARKLNFALRLLTNGTLITQKVANQISQLYPELVAISIYSLNPEIHNEITGVSNSLQKSLSAIKMLQKRKVKLKISTVIMKQNKEDYQSLYDFAQGIGAEFQADYRIAPKTDGNQGPLNFHIADSDLKCVISDPIFLKEEEIDFQENYDGPFNIIPCGAGHMSCYISPYGDVYPCVQLPISCGNLRQKSFSEIWESSPQMSKIRSVTISKLTECSECDFFQYCRLCIGLNYVEKGNMFFPSERICKEAKIAKQLGKRRR